MSRRRSLTGCAMRDAVLIWKGMDCLFWCNENQTTTEQPGPSPESNSQICGGFHNIIIVIISIIFIVFIGRGPSPTSLTRPKPNAVARNGWVWSLAKPCDRGGRFYRLRAAGDIQHLWPHILAHCSKGWPDAALIQGSYYSVRDLKNWIKRPSLAHIKVRCQDLVIACHESNLDTVTSSDLSFRFQVSGLCR